MRHMILASVSAAAILVSGAASAQVIGSLAGGYATITDAGGGDLYGLSGSLATAIGASGWNLEGTGSYYNANPGGLDLWALGGYLYSNTSFGRIAAGGMHGGVGFGHASTYGVGADWFASDAFTVSLKGGGQQTSFGGFLPSDTGGYIGLQGSYYATPNLALSAAFEYLGSGTGDVNSQRFKAEWQFSSTTPLSIYAGYLRNETAGFDNNLIFVGLKFYLDGAPNLVGHHRTGSLGYISQSIFQTGSF